MVSLSGMLGEDTNSELWKMGCYVVFKGCRSFTDLWENLWSIRHGYENASEKKGALPDL